MIGYKGIELRNGILRAKTNGYANGDIFELGVPKQSVDINDGIAFSENGYSFCGTVEDVLGWMDYLTEEKYRSISVDMRLFEVDTLDGVVIGGSSHYKSSKIVVNREISPNEIIQYFTDNPEKLCSEKNKKQFEKYCNDIPSQYHAVKNIVEIKKLMVEKCMRLGQKNVCLQDDGCLDMDKCKSCKVKDVLGDVYYDLSDYYYLVTRSKLYDGVKLSSIEEYNNLQEKSIERRNLEWLSAWIKNGLGD